MKATVRRKVTEELDIAAVKLVLPVRYDEEDIPNDFPGRRGDMWEGYVDFRDDGAFLSDWPADRGAFDFHMKVVDGGRYTLLAPDGGELATVEDDYVPHGVVPGSYGDYVELKIEESGRISNWPRKMDFSEFFPDDK